MLYEIKDIQAYCKTENKMMLSNYDADFWKPYRDNYNYFDRYFMKKYRSWFPMDQEGDLEEVSTDFSFDVKALLMINDKRYSELYRVNTIPDNDAYSLTNNVDVTETTERGVTFNKGAQENEDDFETGYGAQTVDDDRELTYGATSGTDTKSVSAYNSATYDPDEQIEHSTTQHIDSQDNSMTYGAHTDTHGGTHTEGAREDTTDENVTLHRVGNIGVQTVDDMLLKHWENWNLFEFYDLIFSDIAKNLLRGC